MARAAGAGAGPCDLRLSGGRVLLPGLGLHEADVLVRDGAVAGIVSAGTAAAAAQTIDVSGLAVLPGAIDAHIHLGHGADISRPREARDAETESAAAAVGGVTTFIPYILAAQDYAALLPDLVRMVEAGARVDFGMHLVIATPEHLDGLAAYVGEWGVPSFKLFMTSRGEESRRLGLPSLDDGFFFRLLERVAGVGGMLCPHPENIEIAWTLRDRVKQRDPDGAEGLRGWNATRPPFVEAEALRRICYLARMVDAPVYAVHVSSKEALDAALAARAEGARVHIETCVHYLLLDLGACDDVRAKVNPPIRAREDREALWAAIGNGQIDTVGSDHVHRPATSKKGGLWGATPGFPGLDTLLPAFLSEGRRRGLPLEKLYRLVSAAPARIMGLAPRKGAITVGADADFAVVDLDKSWTLTDGDLVGSAGYSVFAGHRFDLQVVHTFVRGRPVLRDRQLVAEAVGTGRYVRRQLAAATA